MLRAHFVLGARASFSSGRLNIADDDEGRRVGSYRLNEQVAKMPVTCIFHQNILHAHAWNKNVF